MTLWSFKLLTMNVVPAILFSVILAGLFALSDRLCIAASIGHLLFDPDTGVLPKCVTVWAYSVLTPITNGETGLQTRAIRTNPETSLLDADLRIIDQAFGVLENGVPTTNFFGMAMSGYTGFLLLCRPADHLLLHCPAPDAV